MTTMSEQAGTIERSKPRRPRLGEELPVFCERCGYSLHGLEQVRCAQCSVLQFHCPECGHHQAINTLRPAFQRMLGRLRATWIVAAVVVKLNFFGWLLFAWFVAGYEYNAVYYRGGYYSYGKVSMDYWPHTEDFLGVGILALVFGLVSRMLVLRWGRDWAVGLVLGGLVLIAMLLGALFRFYDRDMPLQALALGSYAIYATAALMVAIGAMLSWWLWVVAVYTLLPRRAAQGVLDWQKALSSPAVSGLARE